MRISRDQWAMDMAVVTSRRATCLRRSVGCVLLNASGHVLSTGYNGVASGQHHCNHVIYHNDSFGELVRTEHLYMCEGAKSPSGTNLDACQAIHAEQNALLQCRDVYDIHTAYVTSSPCMTCMKLFMNTSCRHIVFIEEYAHAEALNLWLSSPGRTHQKIPGNSK